MNRIALAFTFLFCMMLNASAGGFGDGFGGGGGGIGVAGGTIAGQLVLTRDPASTASADSTLRINPATSAANEKFIAVQDNGTDVFTVDKEGDAALTGGQLTAVNTTGPQIIARSTSASSVAGVTLQNSAGSTGLSIAYGNASVAAPFTSKAYLVTIGTPMMLGNTSANALNTEIIQVYDATSTTQQKLWTIDGEGTLQSHLSTTIGAGDCDADAEVGRIRRYAKDASNITLCGCQKVGGAFGWAAIIEGGDCT